MDEIVFDLLITDLELIIGYWSLGDLEWIQE